VTCTHGEHAARSCIRTTTEDTFAVLTDLHRAQHSANLIVILFTTPTITPTSPLPSLTIFFLIRGPWNRPSYSPNFVKNPDSSRLTGLHDIGQLTSTILRTYSAKF